MKKNFSSTKTQIFAEGSFDLKFVDPQSVIKQLDVREGMKIADFGCGSGHFSLELARKVGEKGVVFAFDILPEKLEALCSQAKNLALTNILTKRENLELEKGSQLPDASIDWVIIKDMLYQNNKKEKILIEARRVVVEKGRILIVEWKTEDASIGPERKLRIGQEKMLEIAQKCGLGMQEEIDAGDFHYGLILIK